MLVKVPLQQWHLQFRCCNDTFTFIYTVHDKAVFLLDQLTDRNLINSCYLVDHNPDSQVPQHVLVNFLEQLLQCKWSAVLARPQVPQKLCR